MLTKLKLRNWQIHKSLTLLLEEITVLVGDNDVGKSSVVRALRWLLLNEWDGEADSFISWGESECEVEAVIDGQTITRIKGNGKNAYLLNGVEFPNFGVRIPQAIQSFLKVSEDNFQNQLDPAFWLLLNPGSAAQALNNIFNLSEIDSTTSNLSKELFSARSKEKETKERLTSAEEGLESLSWVDDGDTKLKEIEILKEKVDSLDRDMGLATEELELLENLDQRRRMLERAIESGEALLGVQKAIYGFAGAESEIESALCLHEKIKTIAETMSEKCKKLTKWLAGACPLCGRSGKRT